MARRLLTLAIILSLCASCAKPYVGVKIPFVATWNGVPLQCDNQEMALSDLRFYVADVALTDVNGESHPVALNDELQWQQTNLAMLDLENGQGACQNGSAEVYSYLVGSLPPGDYQGLQFTVGVPFEQNHADPLQAAAPLDDSAMHWHWRSGYKFLRAGVKTSADGFWIHVGSAGCEGTVRNISGCKFPNRIAVALPDYVLREHTVEIDLAALLEGTSLEDEVTTDCSSGPPEAACSAPFRALGIDVETGEALPQQRVFSLLQ